MSETDGVELSPELLAAVAAENAVEDLVERLTGNHDYVIPTAIGTREITYRVDETGVWKTWVVRDGLAEECIAFKPFLPVRRLRDDKGRDQLTLAWRRDTGEVAEVTVSKDDVADRAKLTRVFPEFVITSGMATECATFIGHCLVSNETWLVENGIRVMTNLGWSDDGTVFTCGPNRPFPVSDSRNTGPWLEGHRTRGTLDSWRTAIWAVRDRRLIMASLAVAFASPLIRLVGAENFVFDLSGTTSRGKTTAARVVASVIGDPDETIFNWRDTKASVDQVLAMVRGVTLIMDETQLASDEDLQSVIYSLTQGRTKAKARQDGHGLQDVVRFETAMFSTGERPILDRLVKGGLTPRTVAANGTPCADKAQAEMLKRATTQHHGHAMPLYVEHLDEVGAETLRTRYLRWQEHLFKVDMIPEAGRRMNSVALMALAAELAFEAELMPSVDLDVWEWLVDGGDAVSDGDGDVATRALREAVTWAAANGNRFNNHQDAAFTPQHGWAGWWEHGVSIGFRRAELDRLLSTLGFDADAVLREWRDRDWIKYRAERRRDKRTGEEIKVPKSFTVMHPLGGRTERVQQVVITHLVDLDLSPQVEGDADGSVDAAMSGIRGADGQLIRYVGPR